MTGTLCCCAVFTVQCGSGCVSGTPGASTSASNCVQSALLRSRSGSFSVAAFSRPFSLSSQTAISAPPAISAFAAEMPDEPRPKTAARLPLKTLIGVMIVIAPATISAQLQGGQPDQRQHDGNDPEADHDLRLGPALLFIMVVDRRHCENAFSRQLERHHLHNDRHRFEHEQSADDGERDLVLG